MESVSVGGVRIAYERRGAGRPVVLVGGTGMPPVAWELCGLRGELVDAGFEVVTYAARGVAPSDATPAPYTVETLAADLAGLLDALRLTDVTVIGYSLGSFTTELLVRTRPDLVRAAVLLAGAGPLTAVLDAVLQAETELVSASGHLPPAFVKLQTLLTSLPPEVLRDDEEQVRTWLELLDAQESVWASREGAAGQLAASDRWMRDELRMSALADIHRPVLVVAFEHDLYFPPRSGKAAAEVLARGQFVAISGAAHAGVLTHPKETTDVLLGFLART
ncbi:pimeloyl-ACP methyl ester carboxylesterase [Streptomyces phaeochromogenes]|jgi:pimeloyl-ACP methyl ester carboxylesterase|uniref:alpha/beta fold hydrolase n=1 Tax=Streptomyces phaeochromogenes TaxID=1923 RepID=UPI002793FFA0|nr:alpha/beta hydrolase [Streptomyces phaeochromogenes]MDQ0947036.1 pimeloyl-ACP methyl ester carboxylesterase [Streptomyces phaeochromogenes]